MALGAALAFGSCTGGVAGCVASLLADGELFAEEAKPGGVGKALSAALDEALNAQATRRPPWSIA